MSLAERYPLEYLRLMRHLARKNTKKKRKKKLQGREEERQKMDKNAGKC